MMSGSRIWARASRIVAAFALCSLTLLSMWGQGAYAADDGVTYKDSNGWELVYSVSEKGTVTIEDVIASGSGTLVIPAKIGGCDVVEIAAKAFYNEGGDDFTSQLTAIEIPDSVTTLGTSAFMGSALESIVIPASVTAIPQSCFAGCASLSEVKFESDAIGYFGESAFSGCSSLVRIDVPELTETVGNETFRMGRKCFYRCTSLETVVFHGDVNTYDPTGAAQSGNTHSSVSSGYYAANIDCFSYCSNLKSVVYYCRRDRIPSGTGSYSFGGDGSVTSSSNKDQFGNVIAYTTLVFYDSAEASANCASPTYTITCKTTVKVRDILDGTVQADDIWAEWGERPSLDDAMTWGVCWNDGENSRVYVNATLADSYNVVPVSRGDLAYGWVSSEAIDEYRDTVSPTGSMGSENYPVFYLDDTRNVLGLDKLAAYLPDGTEADPATYTIHYQRETSAQLDRATTTSYEDVASPDEVGYYRVRAEGISGASAGTHTSWIIINVETFEPGIYSYADADDAARLGRASQAAAKACSDAAICDVVVPAGDWRYQLIGAGLAGVGEGVLLFDNGEDYSSRTVTAFSQSKASALQVIGSTSVVPESASPSAEVYLMDYLNERGIQNKTRYSDDATVQGLADQVYSTIRRLQDGGNTVYGDGWGTTAIVMSPDNCVDTLPIAQCAYELKAPVFFVESGGMLSSADLDYLENDGFTDVFIAGDESFVSDECVSAISSQCGIVPKRLLDAGSDSLDACLDYAAGTNLATSSVVIAAANHPANSVAAALIAARVGGVMLTCSSTTDSKRIQDHLRAIMAEQGQASIGEVYLVGDYTNVDEGLYDRVANMWSNPESSEIVVGDSHEVGDYVYVLKEGDRAQCAYVRNPDLTDAVVESFTYDGVAYTVEAPRAGAFNNATKIKSVTFKEPSITSVPAEEFAGSSVSSVQLGSNITTVGASAFEGCASLKKVSGSAVTTLKDRALFGCSALTSAPTSGLTSIGSAAFCGCMSLRSLALPKATVIGASAFQGCTSLSSVALAKATFIGASAFRGCGKLSNLSIPLAKSIGEAAFQDCTALKSLSAARAISIGPSSFQGCSALASLSIPTVKSVDDSAFSGCSALKSLSAEAIISIGDAAFEGCANMSSAAFGAAGLNKIGAKAFHGCKRLKSLKLNTTKLKKTKVGANAFKGMPKKAKVYVPKKKVKAYRKFFTKKGLAKKKSVVAA